MRRLLLALLFLSAGHTAYAQPHTINMPKSLQGDWFVSNTEGKASCAAYRKHRKAEDVITDIFRIGHHDFKAYAEYGEGNYYVPHHIKAVSNSTWQTTSLLFFDIGDIGYAQEMLKSEYKNDVQDTKSGMLFKLNRDNTLVISDPDGQNAQTRFKCLVPKHLK
ncbi:MAG: hypothetical protein ACRCV6_01865 [Formosimonas sp.]